MSRRAEKRDERGREVAVGPGRQEGRGRGVKG